MLNKNNNNYLHTYPDYVCHNILHELPKIVMAESLHWTVVPSTDKSNIKIGSYIPLPLLHQNCNSDRNKQLTSTLILIIALKWCGLINQASLGGAFQ